PARAQRRREVDADPLHDRSRAADLRRDPGLRPRRGEQLRRSPPGRRARPSGPQPRLVPDARGDPRLPRRLLRDAQEGAQGALPRTPGSRRRMTAAQIRFMALVRREVNRFFKIKRQTLGAPLLETFLYISIFGAALGSRIDKLHGVDYVVFIVPGLIMMAF